MESKFIQIGQLFFLTKIFRPSPMGTQWDSMGVNGTQWEDMVKVVQNGRIDLKLVLNERKWKMTIKQVNYEQNI
jgi:hypothetical protein